MTSSIYIHIPFCSSICTYCNFSKFFYDSNLVSKYLDSLEIEIKERYKGEVIKTLYIGGGTPSSLRIDELKRLFKIIGILNLDNLEEFTIEVNPENINLEKLKLFKDNKVNRISLGVETTNPKHLEYLGRNHDFNLVKEIINLIKEIGINNINVDLIYGLKDQTLECLEKDLDNLLSLDIDHISTYSLILEEHTKLFINKEVNVSEDLDYSMYQLISHKLISNGFNHYEISNFSKKGYESLHNLVYWNNDHYYGFGLSSASYIDNKRINNTKSLNKYLNNFYLDNEEVLDKKDIISYALILGFRLINGLNKEKFKKKYNVNILDLYNIKELIKEGILIDDGFNIFISYDKIYIENSILINFID